jgi:hypothetical protein
MKIFFRIAIFSIFMLTTACSGKPSPGTDSNQPVESNPVPATVEVSVATLEMKETTQNTISPLQTTTPDCLEGEVSPIGMSIADEYASVDYNQVITWFCNGAEFEDILVALETETQTETSAADMLQMLADGFSWEDIWKLSGLTD